MCLSKYSTQIVDYSIISFINHIRAKPLLFMLANFAPIPAAQRGIYMVRPIKISKVPWVAKKVQTLINEVCNLQEKECSQIENNILCIIPSIYKEQLNYSSQGKKDILVIYHKSFCPMFAFLLNWEYVHLKSSRESLVIWSLPSQLSCRM